MKNDEIKVKSEKIGILLTSERKKYAQKREEERLKAKLDYFQKERGNLFYKT